MYFHSNPKERQCQRMFKLPHNCTHLIHQQSNPENSPSQASTVGEPRTSDVQAGFRKGRGSRDKLPTSIGSSKKQENSRKTSTSALLIIPKPLTLQITTNCGKFLEMGIPDHLICLLRNLYAGREATIRTGHGTINWFQIGKGVCQGCILSHYLCNLYAECTK